MFLFDSVPAYKIWIQVCSSTLQKKCVIILYETNSVDGMVYRSVVGSTGTTEKQGELPIGRRFVPPASLLSKLYYEIVN